MILLPALLLPIAAALVGRAVKNSHAKLRDGFFVAAAAAEFLLTALIFAWQTKGNLSVTLPDFCGFGLSFRADFFRSLYALAAGFLWLMTMIFAMEYLSHDHARGRYCFYAMVTLAGVVGVFYSDDLFTTFVFFELMSFASYPLVIHEENREAMRAGGTYLGVAVISGMILLVGIFFLQNEASTLSFEGLRSFFAASPRSPLAYAGGILVLLGFGAKAGMYPLHVWLPQAHPVAPSPASALLSGILTKTGVFGIIVLTANVFAGSTTFGYLLLSLAVVTMFLGALLALFSTNLKRTLACSSMSQIGFILVGVSFSLLLGEEGGLAQNGALLHMVNHSLIKLVLFMCAGVVAMNAHALDLNEIKGYGRNKPFLKLIFAVGALGIMGVPLFNGYVSKTMIHESIVEYVEHANLSALAAGTIKGVEWIFLVSGGLTVAYMLKLFVCVFVEKNADPEKQNAFDGKQTYLSVPSRIVFAVSALPLLFIGLCPNLCVSGVTANAYAFFGVERFNGSVAFFGLESLKGGGVSLAIGAAVFLLLVRKLFVKKGEYLSLWPAFLDLEHYGYRPLLVGGTDWFVRRILSPVAYFFEWLMTVGTLGFVRFIVAPIAALFELGAVRGTVWFILTVVRFFALLFDRAVALLCKTALKPHVYAFREESFSMRVGEWMDKLVYRNKKHRFAEKMDSFTETVGRVASSEYASFSFAYAMISLGIIIVLLIAVFG